MSFLSAHPLTATWIAATALWAGVATVTPQPTKTLVHRQVVTQTVVVTKIVPESKTVPEKPGHEHGAKPGSTKPATATVTLPATTEPTPTLPVPTVTLPLPVPPKKPHPPHGTKPSGWASVFHAAKYDWRCSAHHCH